MDLTVIIPTFNRREILRRALLLYNAQHGMAGRFEVVVVDDGSTDRTAAMLHALHSDLNYPLRCIALPGNAGPSAARNRAIAEAAGRVLLFTGDDILPSERLLLEHWTWHTERFPAPEVGVLGLVHWDEELDPTMLMRWLDRHGTQFAYGAIRHGDAVDYGFLYTSNVSVKRAYLDATKELFDERLRFFEDSEWGLRLVRKGFELRFNENAVGRHLHEVTLASSLRRMEAVGRAGATLHRVSPENFERITHGIFDPSNRMKLWLLSVLLHPALGRLVYVPLARLCERRFLADRIFAASHASHLLKGFVGAGAAGGGWRRSFRRVFRREPVSSSAKNALEWRGRGGRRTR